MHFQNYSLLVGIHEINGLTFLYSDTNRSKYQYLYCIMQVRNSVVNTVTQQSFNQH